MYDFLIPYRKYTVKALEKALQSYLVDFCSYAEALWGSSAGETSMAASTLFRVMAVMVANVWLAKQQFQTWALRAGLELRSTSQVESPNASKAKSIQKFQQLYAAAKLVAQVKDISAILPIDFLHQLFLSRTEYTFSFLTSRKGLRLPYPHSVQRALF